LGNEVLQEVAKLGKRMIGINSLRAKVGYLREESVQEVAKFSRTGFGRRQGSSLWPLHLKTSKLFTAEIMAVVLVIAAANTVAR